MQAGLVRVHDGAHEGHVALSTRAALCVPRNVQQTIFLGRNGPPTGLVQHRAGRIDRHVDVRQLESLRQFPLGDQTARRPRPRRRRRERQVIGLRDLEIREPRRVVGRRPDPDRTRQRLVFHLVYDQIGLLPFADEDAGPFSQHLDPHRQPLPGRHLDRSGVTRPMIQLPVRPRPERRSVLQSVRPQPRVRPQIDVLVGPGPGHMEGHSGIPLRPVQPHEIFDDPVLERDVRQIRRPGPAQLPLELLHLAAQADPLVRIERNRLGRCRGRNDTTQGNDRESHGKLLSGAIMPTPYNAGERKMFGGVRAVQASDREGQECVAGLGARRRSRLALPSLRSVRLASRRTPVPPYRWLGHLDPAKLIPLPGCTEVDRLGAMDRYSLLGCDNGRDRGHHGPRLGSLV